MTVEDVPLSVRREIVREHYRAMQLRATHTRLSKHTPEQRQAHAKKAWSNRFKTQADKDAHGKAMNRASQRTYAKRRQGISAEQLLAKRRQQQRAYKERVKAGIKPQKTTKPARPLALTPIVLLTQEAVPAPTCQPQSPPTSNCPRCGQPSDGGLCAGCVLSAALPKHVRD